MAEYKLFEGQTPFVSTYEFHEHRERAPHLEQPGHQGRLFKAIEFIQVIVENLDEKDASVSDLGCGDGGLLSHVQRISDAWGYDFQPSNKAGWDERGVKAQSLDVFNDPKSRSVVKFGTVSVMTEILEHLADPHGALKWVASQSEWLVASSPYVETSVNHDPCHAWAWDTDGYKKLIEEAGFAVLRHECVGGFQVVQARVQ